MVLYCLKVKVMLAVATDSKSQWITTVVRMGAEGQHLLHSVLQGPRLLPSHDAAVSTSDLKAWCILGRETEQIEREHTCSQQPQPGHEASVLLILLARTSPTPSLHPHDVGLGSVVQPCAQEEKTGLVVMICHIQDTRYFYSTTFFFSVFNLLLSFKNDISNIQKHACYTKSTETCTQLMIYSRHRYMIYYMC